MYLEPARLASCVALSSWVGFAVQRQGRTGLESESTSLDRRSFSFSLKAIEMSVSWWLSRGGRKKMTLAHLLQSDGSQGRSRQLPNPAIRLSPAPVSLNPSLDNTGLGGYAGGG